jgi:serine/threonine protein phosphatase 1
MAAVRRCGPTVSSRRRATATSRALSTSCARGCRRVLAFLRELSLSHVEGDFYFVHAGIKPGVPLDGQAVEDLLWIRDEFLLSRADFGKIVVHGHTITDAPEVRQNRIGIDTGAFASGKLTCLVLAGESWSFLQT